jgi:hypothetical protein
MCSTKKPSERFDRVCSSRWEAVAEAAAVEAAVALGAAGAAMAVAAAMAAALEAAMVAAASSLGGAVVAEVAVWCREAAAQQIGSDRSNSGHAVDIAATQMTLTGNARLNVL